VHKKIFSVFPDDQLVLLWVKELQALFYIIQADAAPVFFRIIFGPQVPAVVYIKV
jgi:hypothetical protein